MKPNLLIGQSGGPTAVINASLYGILEAAKKSSFQHIYGANHGVEGILKDSIVELTHLHEGHLERIKLTPGAFLGGCRYRLKERDSQKTFNVFEKYNIKGFIYIGGNDSMDTAYRISQKAKESGSPLQVIGVPKTVDNDLAKTHHSPGFGSAAKYVATSVREAGLHTKSMYTSEPITILETVGRNTGWLPGAGALAREGNLYAPHLIYLPEVPFSIDSFLLDVERVFKEHGGVFIVVGEGLKDKEGQYVQVDEDEVATDPFGHPMLGSVSFYLKDAIEESLQLKTRCIKLDICQQSAMHLVSRRDLEDAIAAGRSAVRAIENGNSGSMVTLEETPGSTGLVDLELVANKEKVVPKEWINQAGNHVAQPFIDYAQELILGEVQLPMVNGLPHYSN